MKTDDLITLLSQGEGAARPPRDGRGLALGLAAVFPLLVALVAFVDGLVPFSLWPASATLWKVGYATALASGAVWLLRRAGRPGAAVAGPVVVVLALLATAIVVGVLDWLAIPPGMQVDKLTGHSALYCPVAILVMSVPMLGVAMAAARSLAPVQPTLAGAAAGMVAGGVAAVAYGLACTEGALVFVAVWYTLGMLLATALGALAGWLVLRW